MLVWLVHLVVQRISSNAWEKKKCRTSFINSVFCPRKRSEVIVPIVWCLCAYYTEYLFLPVNENMKITLSSSSEESWWVQSATKPLEIGNVSFCTGVSTGKCIGYSTFSSLLLCHLFMIFCQFPAYWFIRVCVCPVEFERSFL